MVSRKSGDVQTHRQVETRRRKLMFPMCQSAACRPHAVALSLGFALLIGAELNAEIDKALPGRDDEPQSPHHAKKIGPALKSAEPVTRL